MICKVLFHNHQGVIHVSIISHTSDATAIAIDYSYGIRKIKNHPQIQNQQR